MTSGERSSSARDPAASLLAARIARQTGTSPLNCYQCGRCAAGCLQNIPGEMDLSPTRLMRLIQLETAFAEEPKLAAAFAQQALSADTPWLCAGCQACTTRCPQGLDVAGTMDLLRQEAIQRGVASRSRRARDVQALHKSFLEQALKQGRIHEVLLVMAYKLRTGHLFQDVLLAPLMFLKGKLRLLPEQAPSPQAARTAAREIKG